jgi:hypothetical protein
MSDEANQGPTPIEIVAALENTGFMLEQRAAQQLEALGFDVMLNDPFPDPDEGKSRELDLTGQIDYPLSGDVSITGTVLVECKNYSNPVILIGTESFSDTPIVDTCFVDFNPLSLGFKRRGARPIEHALHLNRGAPDGQSEVFIGNQLVLMNRKSGKWVAENSSIHDSVQLPLLKARQYEVKRLRENPGESAWMYPGVMYCFPVLLLSRDIYTVAVRDRGEPEVTKAKWAILRRSFHLKGSRTALTVDVVSFHYFNEYIQKRILGTLARARGILDKHANLFNPEWLLNKYGKPKEERVFNDWLKDFRARNPADISGVESGEADGG